MINLARNRIASVAYRGILAPWSRGSPGLTAGKTEQVAAAMAAPFLSLRQLHRSAEMSDHPFTYDRWATPDDPELGVVRFDDLRKIERACLGIWAIARIVGNSANEPGATGARPLDAWMVSNLLGGVESLCDQIADLAASSMDEPPLDPLFSKAGTSTQ